MKNKLIIFGFVCLVLGTIIISKTVFSEEIDPLVTQSYVEMRIEELKSLFQTPTTPSQNSNNTSTNEEISKYIKFVPVELQVGDNLIGGAGSEMVLRSGKGKGISSGDGGLLDVTDGVDLQEDQNIPLHHLMVTPRDDGRGIRITTASAFVMVKGSYKID